MCEDVLERGLEGMGIAADGKTIATLSLYMDEIALFNPVYKLVSYKDERELAVRHILDSASGEGVIASLLTEDRRVADLGSGAGLPGIVLAILMKDAAFTLVERMARRVDFLRNVVAKCRLDNVEVLAEDVGSLRRTFPLVTFRAFHQLGDIMKPLDRILADGGKVCAYKARKDYVDDELKGLEGWSHRMVPLCVPSLEGERLMLILERKEV